MTSYSGIVYLLFFLPVVLLVYSILNVKLRRFWILFSGIFFFCSISGSLVLFLFMTIVTMYFAGLWIDKIKKSMKNSIKGLPKEEKKQIKAGYIAKQKRVVWLFVLINLGTLVILKYSGFFAEIIKGIAKNTSFGEAIKVPAFIVPIGISFYTFMGMSYILDVYRDVIPVDRNFLRVALYMCFFPDIMEGPFARYSDTAESIYECKSITYENLTFGCQRILYGLFKKMLVADRLNAPILNIFESFDTIDGGLATLGMLMYTIQLYCEFSGTMDIVIGTAEIFGVKLPENFKRPFFSKTISEFWTRWHITLGSWFKDYIYYPVSMAPSMKELTKKARKKLGNHYGPLVAGTIALFLVWIANGLWHGAGWTYVCFGMYHFVLISIGNLSEPVVRNMMTGMKVDRNKGWYKAIQIVRTFILINFGELIFRAEGMRAAIIMIKKIFTDFSFDFLSKNRIYTYGMDKYDFIVVGVALLVILIMSVLAERGVNVRVAVAKKPIYIRWALYLLLIVVIVVFGAYGMGYLPVDPIYAGF